MYVRLIIRSDGYFHINLSDRFNFVTTQNKGRKQSSVRIERIVYKEIIPSGNDNELDCRRIIKGISCINYHFLSKLFDPSS